MKPRLLGHFGTTPGLNLIWAHMNRAIRARDLDAIYVTGPGHGGPGIVANAYLEGTYSELFPLVSSDERGLHELFRQFSFPGGIPSHAAPETPGSIHEGGELGYALTHAYGAAFDNPDLLVCCVVGDGEAETGPLAASWHSNKFLNPKTDGAVLPILHLNGYKIANPTVLARIPEEELVALFEGYGHRPILVTGDDPEQVHGDFAAALDDALDDIAGFKGHETRPKWPMIVLRTPKGWTGPKVVDGLPVEGTWRSHQVPIADVRENAEHLRLLEDWMRSYRPEELFDDEGRLVAELAALPPKGDKRMSASPHTTGERRARPRPAGFPRLRGRGRGARTVYERGDARPRQLPARRDHAQPARPSASSAPTRPPRTGSPPSSRRRTGPGRRSGCPRTRGSRRKGGCMEVLSEHLCQGWLEGYLLTGRHGFFNCYEAFIHIVDSMFNQHAKWLKVTRHIPWRRPLPSLNYLLSSHVWRQDHNGFSHQDPGFIDHVVNKKAEVIRVYLPPDANTLLSVADHCLRSRHYVNVIVAGKQPALDYLSMDDAIVHCTRGLGIWDWASNDGEGEPDVVMACAGDVPDPRDARRRLDPARAAPGPEGARRQRRRPDAAPAGERASARPAGQRVRLAVHARPADRLRLPRLPVADSPPHLPAHEPRQPARARLQGGGHDDHAVRHGHAQRPRPLPPRDRRHRPRPRPRLARGARAAGDGGRTAPLPGLDARARRGSPDVRDWVWPT